MENGREIRNEKIRVKRKFGGNTEYSLDQNLKLTKNYPNFRQCTSFWKEVEHVKMTEAEQSGVSQERHDQVLLLPF